MHAIPDLYILDKALRVIDGPALCKWLKVKEETKDVPIIMMSSYHKLKNKARELGADDFIEKPFDIKRLFSFVDSHLTNVKLVFMHPQPQLRHEWICVCKHRF